MHHVEPHRRRDPAEGEAVTRPDAEVIAEWTERAAVREFEARMPRSQAEEAAASEFTGREAAVVAIHRAKLAAARDARQARLFG